MESNGNLVMAVIGIATTCLAGVGVAMRLMWNAYTSNVDETKKEITAKLNDCEEKHEATTSEMHVMAAKVGGLEAKLEAVEDRELTRKLCVKVLERLERKSGATGS